MREKAVLEAEANMAEEDAGGSVEEPATSRRLEREN
jgi:hypothetical protein